MMIAFKVYKWFQQRSTKSTIAVTSLGFSALTLFSWHQIILLVILLFSSFQVFKLPDISSKKDGFFHRLEFLIFMALVLVFVLTRAFPYIYSSFPLGFDTGLYRYQLLQGEYEPVASFTPLWSIFIVLTRLVALPVDLIITWGWGWVAVLVFLICAKQTRDYWGKSPMMLGLLLLCVSQPFWLFYQHVFFKQGLALCLFLLLIPATISRKWWWGIVLISLCLLHPLPGIIFVITAVLWGGIEFFKKHETRLFWCVQLGIVFFLAIIFGFFYFSFIQQLFHVVYESWIFSPGSDPSLQTGVFIPLNQVSWQISLTWVLASIAVFKNKKNVYVQFLLLLLIVICIWVLLKAPLYQRLFVELDIILILLASGIVSIRNGFVFSALKKILITVFILASVGLSFVSWLDYSPELQQSELQSIRQLCLDIPPQHFIMTIDSFYAPWLRGWCPHNPIIAPGMFAWNYLSLEEWKALWNQHAENQQEWLNQYPEDIYLFLGERHAAFSPPQQFKPLKPYWYWFNSPEVFSLKES